MKNASSGLLAIQKFIFITFLVFIFTWKDAFAQSPTINSFTPTTGPVGTLVHITGSNLNNPTSFQIGGVDAIVVSNDGNNLVGMVMPGATTGNINVANSNGNIISTNTFMIDTTKCPNTQQGSKLIGTGNVGLPVYQGSSIAISADGNTAIVGGSNDNSQLGAAWIYTRNGGVWIQQGNKLVGTGNVGINVFQGVSVAISAMEIQQ